MKIPQEFDPLIAPTLLLLPLLLFQGSLATPTQLLVIVAWVTLPFCYRWPSKAPIIGGLALFALALALGITNSTAYLLWLFGIALFCFLSLKSTLPKGEQKEGKISVEKQRSLLSEQERFFRDQHTKEHLKAQEQLSKVQKELQAERELNRTLSEERSSLEAQLSEALIAHTDSSAALKKIQQEYDDLQVCYRHLNSEPQLDLEEQRYRALYLQLKEQFAEKTTQLDATRKELFLAKEELSARGIESAESSLERSEVLLRVSSLTHREAVEELAIPVHQEIEALEELVSVLMTDAVALGSSSSELHALAL